MISDSRNSERADAVHPKLYSGILADRRSGFASCLVSESSPHDEFCKNMGGTPVIQNR
jgi:hypothetical protein